MRQKLLFNVLRWGVFGVLILVLLSFAVRNAQAQKVNNKSFFAMDTFMTLTAYGSKGAEALEEAEVEIYRLEQMLSTGISDSEVAELNRTGEGVLNADMTFLWEESLQITGETDGAFDVTIYPVMRAWGFTGREKRIPDALELTRLLEAVDASRVIWNDKTGQLNLPEGAELDFGGIAKGYTGARLSVLLKKMGVKSALLNLGGNVQLVGSKPDGSPFRVAVKSPFTEEGILGVLEVADTAVVTSGGYERYFEENGERYHHIIDPKTGYPAKNGLISVTIVCDNGTLADGYSTALYVLGPEKANAFWKEHQDVFQMVYVTDDGSVYATEGLKDCFTSDYDIEWIIME